MRRSSSTAAVNRAISTSVPSLLFTASSQVSSTPSSSTFPSSMVASSAASAPSPAAAAFYPSPPHPPPYPPSPSYPPSGEGPSTVSVALLCPSWSPSLPPSSASSASVSGPPTPSPSPSPLSSPHPSSSSSVSSPSGSPSVPSFPLQPLHPHQLKWLYREYPLCEEMNLSHNRLSSLCSFSLFSRVVLLDLSFNRLPSSSLVHLSPLLSLSVLSLSHNFLHSLRPLPSLPSLTSLDVSCNFLIGQSPPFSCPPPSLEEEVALPLISRCPSLQRLTVQGNPFFCEEEPHHRIQLLASLRPLLRHLQWIDGRPTTSEGGRGGGGGGTEGGGGLKQSTDHPTSFDGRREQGGRDRGGDDGTEREEVEEEVVELPFRGPNGTERRSRRRNREAGEGGGPTMATFPSSSSSSSSSPSKEGKYDGDAIPFLFPFSFSSNPTPLALKATLQSTEGAPSTSPSSSFRLLRRGSELHQSEQRSSPPPRLNLSDEPSLSSSNGTIAPTAFPSTFSSSDLVNGASLRREVSALRVLLSEEEEVLSWSVGVESKGLSLWRAALCRLLVHLQKEEERRAGIQAELSQVQRKAKAEANERERRIHILVEEFNEEREALVTAYEDSLGKAKLEWEMSFQQMEAATAETAVTQRKDEEDRQRKQIKETIAGVKAALNQTDKSLTHTWEELNQRLMEVLSRLQFASQRLQMLSTLQRQQRHWGMGMGMGMVMGKGIIGERDRKRSAVVAVPSPPLFESATAVSVDGAVGREVERLRQDRALLLSSHEEWRRLASVEVMEGLRRVDELHRECQQLRQAKAAADGDFAKAKAAFDQRTTEKMSEAVKEAVERQKKDSEALVDLRVERLRAELLAEREEREALQRENVGLAVEVRALQRKLQGEMDSRQKEEQRRWREFDEQMRRAAEALQKSEREKEEMKGKWRQLLHQHIHSGPPTLTSTHSQPVHALPPPHSYPQFHGPPPQSSPVSALSASGVVMPPPTLSSSLPITARLHSLAQLSHRLLHEEE